MSWFRSVAPPRGIAWLVRRMTPSAPKAAPFVTVGEG
jgi:hypothetical protein